MRMGDGAKGRSGDGATRRHGERANGRTGEAASGRMNEWGDAMTKAPDPVGRRTRRAEDVIALSK